MGVLNMGVFLSWQKNQRRNYAGFVLPDIRLEGGRNLLRHSKNSPWFESTRAHQKNQRRNYAEVFVCDKAKLIGRVDSNSCGTVQQDDLQQYKDQQNNKNRSVLCIIIFCNGIQVGTLCIDFLNFSSKNH